MANQFGGPSGQQSFLSGLIGGTAQHFQQEHDRQQAEDMQRKQMDYQILMAAMEQMKPNMTPSQAGEILTRATDIFKPKGHGDIKDRLKEVFGMQQPYSMQGGTILQQAMNKPRLQVGTTNAPTGDTTPSVFGPPGNQVTLPPPPGPERPVYEQTYREQGISDADAQAQRILNRQMTMEDIHDQHQRERIRLRRDEMVRQYKETLPLKEQALAERKLLAKAAERGDVNDESNLEWARGQLQQEDQDKHDYSQSRIAVNAERLKQIDSSIQNATTRINIAKQKLGRVGAINFDKNPQVKGAWIKVQAIKADWQSALTHAAEAYANGDVRGGKYYDGIADRAQENMQTTINAIEQKVNELQQQAGGVKLPNPPATGGTRKSGVKLTEAEIRAAGGTDATVQRARDRGQLAP